MEVFFERLENINEVPQVFFCLSGWENLDYAEEI
jgi:hypothetical protein